MLPIVERDRALLPYNNYLEQQQARFARVRASLTGGGRLCDFANAHEYFGVHHTREGWVYREWAPAADGVSLMGDFNGWDETACPLTRGENGVWELRYLDNTYRNQKSGTVKLQVFLTGNLTAKPNATLSLKVSIK